MSDSPDFTSYASFNNSMQYFASCQMPWASVLTSDKDIQSLVIWLLGRQKRGRTGNVEKEGDWDSSMSLDRFLPKGGAPKIKPKDSNS